MQNDNSGIPRKKLAYAKFYSRLTNKITEATGSPVVTISAFLLIILWAICGPIFSFSDTWQLAINTSTTIVTFLMVFVIQRSQNKDTTAIHLKLNELIAANNKASNRLVDIEDLTEEELKVLKKFYVKLSKHAKDDKDLFSSHSLDEAEKLHRQKTTSKK